MDSKFYIYKKKLYITNKSLINIADIYIYIYRFKMIRHVKKK